MERRTERDKGDTLRQVQDALDDVRQQPIKELGVPDRGSESGKAAVAAGLAETGRTRRTRRRRT